MNKKGVIGDIPLWTYRLLILLAVFFSIGIIISQYGTFEVDTKDLEFNVLFNRMIYSKNCLLFENERIYPGIIDMDKFNEIVLRDCFKNDNQGIKLSLGNKDDLEYKEIFVNKEFYESNALLCNIPGKGGFKCKSKQFFVLIKDKDFFRPEFLNMGVIKKNE